MQKLEYYGIRGIAYNWFKSYLSEREVIIRITHNSNKEIKDFHSTSGKLQYGVPQGSILGPILFLVYINDLVANFPAVEFCIFADDTSIINSSDNLEDLSVSSSQQLKEIINWFSSNKLCINTQKTLNITFHPNTSINQINIEIPYGEIKGSTNVKFLGIHVDERLDWKEHIYCLNKKLCKATYAIATIRKNIGTEAAMTTYYAYFYSIIQYGIEFWGHAVDIDSTLIIQKRALRAICGIKRMESCRSHFERLKILTIINLYLYRLSLLAFKKKHELEQHADIHSYNTRNRSKYVPPQFNYAVNRKGPLYMAVKTFNHLPSSISEITSINIFKKKVKHFFQTHVYYNTREFFNSNL